VLRVAADNTIIYANPASKPLLYTWDSEVGNHLPETLQSVINDTINSKSTKEIEAPCGDITYLLTITPVKDENYVNIYGLDITTRKKAEEKAKEHQRKIEQQNIQLKELDELKTNFLKVTTHELRTPMASIKGYVQMILKQTLGRITDEERDALNVVLRNINRLDHLIQDILDLSRLESKNMKYIPEKTNIGNAVSEIKETMHAEALEKNIKIISELDGNLPEIIVDKDRIKQVFMNIVGNSIKFSPDGAVINIKGKKQKNTLLFEIQDHGRGVPKDLQEKIFNTFYQVDYREDKKYGGTGLGLAISKSIIEAHGGKIWIESTGKLGEGSTVKFTLPENSEDLLKKQIKENNISELETPK